MSLSQNLSPARPDAPDSHVRSVVPDLSHAERERVPDLVPDLSPRHSRQDGTDGALFRAPSRPRVPSDLDHFLAHSAWASVTVEEFLVNVEACGVDRDLVRAELDGFRLVQLTDVERAEVWRRLRCGAST